MSDRSTNRALSYLIILIFHILHLTYRFTAIHWNYSSPGTSIARWLKTNSSGAAPCQCFTSAGILMQSPGFISTLHLCLLPDSILFRQHIPESVHPHFLHDGYASYFYIKLDYPSAIPYSYGL